MEDSTTSPSHIGNPLETRRQTFQSARRWTENSLDEEMAKFFRPPDRESLKTMIEMGPEVPKEIRRKFDETDYRMHRGESFPHIHHPLKALHSSRSSKRRRTSSKPSQTELENEQFNGCSSVANIQQQQSFEEAPSDIKHRKVGFYLGERAQDSTDSMSFDEGTKIQIKEPRVVGKGAVDSSSMISSVTSSQDNIQYPSLDAKTDAGEESKDKEERDGEEETHHKHRHKHHHRHKHSRKDDEELMSRQRTGSEVEASEIRMPTEAEEAMLLQEGDLNIMASHRFDDARGMRRHKIQGKVVMSSFIGPHKDSLKKLPFSKKIYDHQPHNIFVELDELLGSGNEREWKETARWIKYEEDLEEGSNRWGKPHLASLTFHSLLNLRKCLEQGIILLDLEEKDLPGIAYRVVEAMVSNDQIKPEDKGAVMRVLLLRHKHVTDHHIAHSFAGLRRNLSSNVSSLTQLNEDGKSKLSKNLSFTTSNEENMNMVKIPLMSDSRKNSHDSTSIKLNNDGSYKLIDIKDGSPPNGSVFDVETALPNKYPAAPDTYIMRKIPEGCEGTTVLVGAVDFLEVPAMAFVRLAEGIPIPSTLEVPLPVRFMFVLLGPADCKLDYHEIGRSFSTLMSDRRFHTAAYQADEREDLMRGINEFLDNSIVLAPNNFDSRTLDPTQIGQIKDHKRNLRRRKRQFSDTEVCIAKKSAADSLRRTGRLFGGLRREIMNRYPLYWSDIKDSFNPQCVASVVFIYFAALSGAISFGGLLGDKTNNLIGVPETLIATSLSGCIFSLVSGQPLMIIGVTGPVLLFDESLYRFCVSEGYDFLTIRTWIGIWVALFTTIFVMFEGSFFLRFITRFTEEILAALISIIFIYESIVKLVEIFQLHPLTPFVCPSVPINRTALLMNHTDFDNESYWSSSTPAYVNNMTNSSFKINKFELQTTNEPNTALLSTILMFGTFFIAFFLRQFRNGKYLGRMARRALGDFGVPIAIIIMVSLDYLIHETYTQKLQVPSGLTPSDPEVRGWFINPLGKDGDFPVWLMFGSILPAILFFILIFMEEQIGELLVQKKERKLCKGTGYHVDILVVNYLNMGCAFIGGPWMSAAIVRAISHIMSLTVMSSTHAPGDKPYIVGVKEQRVTNFCVSLLVGVSVAMAPLLRLIPVPVLFGVFLYMGFVSMIGVQFFERIRLLAMPVKHHPDVVYVRRVRTCKMYAFTIIQVVCFAILWAVKASPAAIALPFVLLLMIPVRWQFKFFFSESELQALDGTTPDEVNEEEEDDDDELEKDFYQEAKIPG